MKPRVLGLFVQDLRTSHIRARARRLGRRELWLLYQELLWALHNAGGELSSDPELLADETEFFTPAEVSEMLPLLAPAPGKLGGIVVDGDVIRNPRLAGVAAEDAAYRAERAQDGKRSAESRRQKHGTAQPPRKSKGPSTAPEGTFDGSRRDPEGAEKQAGGSLEPPSPSFPSPSTERQEPERARGAADRSDRPLFPSRADLAEGHGYIRAIVARDGLDPVDVCRRASWWNGSELLRLEDATTQKRLDHTLARLRTWAQTGRTPEKQRAEGPAESGSSATSRAAGARPPTASERVETERQRGADLLAQEQAERRRRLLGDQAPAAAPALPPGGSR